MLPGEFPELRDSHRGQHAVDSLTSFGGRRKLPDERLQHSRKLRSLSREDERNLAGRVGDLPEEDVLAGQRRGFGFAQVFGRKRQLVGQICSDSPRQSPAESFSSSRKLIESAAAKILSGVGGSAAGTFGDGFDRRGTNSNDSPVVCRLRHVRRHGGFRRDRRRCAPLQDQVVGRAERVDTVDAGESLRRIAVRLQLRVFRRQPKVRPSGRKCGKRGRAIGAARDGELLKSSNGGKQRSHSRGSLSMADLANQGVHNELLVVGSIRNCLLDRGHFLPVGFGQPESRGLEQQFLGRRFACRFLGALDRLAYAFRPARRRSPFRLRG